MSLGLKVTYSVRIGHVADKCVLCLLVPYAPLYSAASMLDDSRLHCYRGGLRGGVEDTQRMWMGVVGHGAALTCSGCLGSWHADL